MNKGVAMRALIIENERGLVTLDRNLLPSPRLGDPEGGGISLK